MTDTPTTEVSASFSKNGAESDSVADWIKLARLPEKSATICLRADLQADFDELSAEHKRLEDNARLDARLASSVSGLQNEMARIRAEIEKSYRTFRFRALTRLYRDGQRWRELRTLLDTRQLAELDVRERLDLLAQIADLDESALGDDDHAVAVLVTEPALRSACPSVELAVQVTFSPGSR